MKKVNWLKVSEGVAFLIIAILFIGLKFYAIQDIVVYEGVEYTVQQLNYAAFQKLFHDIFQAVYYNIYLFLLFMYVGIVKIIQGVRKNGN